MTKAKHTFIVEFENSVDVFESIVYPGEDMDDVVEINMLNMLGEFVTSVRFKNTSEPISVTHLAKGVYILVELNTGKVQKLILQ